MLSTNRHFVFRVSCSVSVSCVTSRACEAVGAKFSSRVGVCLGSVSGVLLRRCPAGVPPVSCSFSHFTTW